MSVPKHTFFCEEIQMGILSEEESIHAIRVLRLGKGDLIRIIDGQGTEAIASISDAHKKHCAFEIIESQCTKEPDLKIQIAIAPTKNLDRFQFFVEKVTEIGITKITPLLCQNSERDQLKVDKIRKNLISAIKQSGNLFLPVIAEPTSFKDFIADNPPNHEKFIAWCADDQEKQLLQKAWMGGNDVIILIGPEGDFTAEEVILAKENGFSPVSLGESRLRTETAGIAACHTLHVISSLSSS